MLAGLVSAHGTDNAMDILHSILAAALGVVVTAPRATTIDVLQVSMTIAPSCTILVPDLSRGLVQRMDWNEAAAMVKVDCNDVRLSIAFVRDGAGGAGSFPGPDLTIDELPKQVAGDLTDIISVITF